MTELFSQNSLLKCGGFHSESKVLKILELGQKESFHLISFLKPRGSCLKPLPFVILLFYRNLAARLTEIIVMRI